MPTCNCPVESRHPYLIDFDFAFQGRVAEGSAAVKSEFVAVGLPIVGSGSRWSHFAGYDGEGICGVDFRPSFTPDIEGDCQNSGLNEPARGSSSADNSVMVWSSHHHPVESKIFMDGCFEVSVWIAREFAGQISESLIGICSTIATSKVPFGGSRAGFVRPAVIVGQAKMTAGAAATGTELTFCNIIE